MTRPSQELNQCCIENPQIGDYWHEMFCIYHAAMKVIVIEKEAAKVLESSKSPDITRLLLRHLRLIEVPDQLNLPLGLWISRNTDKYLPFSVYVTFYRQTAEGWEIADIGDTETSQCNFYGSFYTLDESDWNRLTIESDFDLDEMYAAVLKIAFDDVQADLFDIAIETTRENGILDYNDPVGGESNFVFYTSFGVIVPMGKCDNLKWIPLRQESEMNPVDCAIIRANKG